MKPYETLFYLVKPYPLILNPIHHHKTLFYLMKPYPLTLNPIHPCETLFSLMMINLKTICDSKITICYPKLKINLKNLTSIICNNLKLQVKIHKFGRKRERSSVEDQTKFEKFYFFTA